LNKNPPGRCERILTSTRSDPSDRRFADLFHPRSSFCGVSNESDARHVGLAPE